jgi:hypothetical protein
MRRTLAAAIVCAAAVPLNAAEMTVTYPVRYALIQRSSPEGGRIPVVGRYSGTVNPGKIEARFNGGTWQVLDPRPENGAFSGTIEGAVGQGSLDLRATGEAGLRATVETVAVGDLFVIAGQSNADGRGSRHVTLNPSNRYVGVKYRKGAWSKGDDPSANDGDYGSPWPMVLDDLIADQKVPAGFIAAAVGSTVVKQWRKGGGLYTRMTGMVKSATGGTMKIKAVLYYQGENDITHYNSYSVLGDYAEYKKNLLAAATDVRSDFAAPILVGQITNLGSERDRNDNVRRAQQESWAEHPAVLPGAVTYDIFPTDGCHYREEPNMRAFAGRWTAAILASLYGKKDCTGPKLMGIAMVDDRTLKLSFDRPVTIAKWDGTAGTKALGFRIKDGAKTLTDANVAATVVNRGDVVLKLGQPVSPSATVCYGCGNDGQGQPTLRDAGNRQPIAMMFDRPVGQRNK